MTAPTPASSDALMEHLRHGSEFTLHSFSPDHSSIISRRIFLFLRDVPPPSQPGLYGKAGSLYWTLIPANFPTSQHFLASPTSRLELDHQRLPLHTLTDLRSAKQTDVLRHPSLARVPDTTCFALSSSGGVEMNLQALTVEEKERWWNGVMAKLKSGKKQLKITSSSSSSVSTTSRTSSPSPSPSPSPALIIRGPTPSPLVSPSPSHAASQAASLSPTSLKRTLNAGAFFNKFDLDPVSGQVHCSSIFLWAEGVGKQGDLYWVEAKPQLNFVPPPSNVLPASHCLPLGRITDFMLRKKSPALKASQAPDACCFALVSADKTTLNLECESKEVCKNWREGLIGMLLTAGKQVVRADASSIPIPSQPLPSSSPVFSPSPQVVPGHVKRSPSEEKELFQLSTGAVFTLYYTNSKHQPEQAKILLFFVDLPSPSDPGALCWCNVGSKRMIEGQRLMLNSMKQMISGYDHPSFRHSTGDVDLSPDQCFTIVGKALILNLEASNPAIRETWMKGLHSIMTRYQQDVAHKKQQQQDLAQRAAKEIIASNEGQFAHAANHPPGPSISPTPASPNPTLNAIIRTPSPGSANHSPSPSFSLPSFDEQVGRLKRGDVFTLYTASPVSPSDIQSHSIFLFFVDDPSGPGYLYYCAPPPTPRQLLDHQRFSLASLSKMVGGKETAIFQNERMRSVPVDRCLSIIGKHSMLNVEAKGVDTRDLWIKTLHSIMTRFKPSKQSPALTPGAPSSNGVAHSGASTPLGAMSPGGGSTPPSPSSQTNPALSSNPLFNPSAPPSPQPQSHSLISGVPVLTASPAPLPALPTFPATPSSSLASEPEAVYLSTAHTFKMYAGSPAGFPLISDVSVFFQAAPAASADYPGALYYCVAGKREVKEGQKLLLNRIQQMAGGKETAIFKHPAAAAVPKDRCMYLISPQATWSLEAASVDLKNAWMTNVHSLLTKMGRQRVDDKRGKLERSSSLPLPPTEDTPGEVERASTPPVNGHAPGGPHVPAAAPVVPTSTSPQSAALAKSTVDIKTAQQTVQAGQLFTLYQLSPTGEPVAERLFFFFLPATGAEQPGVLYWSHPDHPHEVDAKRRFVLNSIKQMRAGKDTPILKSAIAAKARSSHCLSLSSSLLTLNLEAPSADIAELWRKSLHTVLVRHGMKAVEDQPAAGAAPVTPSSAAAAVTPVGASRPLNSAVATHINRTINFMDPTEFFSLKAKIGEGSYGAVYKAIDHRDGQAVAIKIIPFSGKDSLKLRKEIRTLRQCHSPFIVGYKGAFHKQENVWIVMEYCAAGSLSDMMQICKRTLSEAQISNIMRQCLAGLAYLHGQGKIHRDIKGGNILSDSHGMMKLADFGVSGNLDKTLGKHRTVIGTPHWMAPEVLMSDDYNELADIWSLGITAYELAIGEPPHAKLHSMRAALKIPMSPPPTLPDPSHWSEGFHAFLRSCLVKDFHQRPSAGDLLSHPFIVNAANASVLMDMVRVSVKVIEAKASELSKEQAQAATAAAVGGPGGGGQAKGASVGEVDDDIDDEGDEEEAPRIRPNPKGSG